MSIMDQIKQRHSIRVYHQQEIENEILNKIQQKIDGLNPMFGAKIRFMIIHKNDVSGIKLGTYGVISGATTFLVGCYEDSPYAKVALGYAMEEILLYCTELGIGTCFLGGTYKKGHFARAIALQKNEKIALISPLGYPSSTITLMARIMGSSHAVKSRKPFANIVYEVDFKTPIKQDNRYRLPLEMFRLAPSALNAQPWCALVDHKQVHLYLTSKNHGYAMYDIGIALAHFDLVCREMNMIGKLIPLPVGNYPQYSRLHYVMSFVEE